MNTFQNIAIAAPLLMLLSACGAGADDRIVSANIVSADGTTTQYGQRADAAPSYVTPGGARAGKTIP